MPLPAIIGAALGAGSSILGNILSGRSTKRENARNRQFSEQMYKQQRTDSLADWAMENEYNSPKNQMARLRDAGLNPALVYGHGATAESGNVRSSSASVPTGQAAQYDLSGVGQSIGQYQDIKLREAQTDNLAAQNKVIQQDAILRAAQVQQTLAGAHTQEFDLKMKDRLKEISADMAEVGLTKERALADKAWSDATVSEASIKPNIDKAVAEAKIALNQSNASTHLERRVLQELDNLKKDGDIKKFQINLNRLGVNSSDPWYLRIMTQLFGKYVPNP